MLRIYTEHLESYFCYYQKWILKNIVLLPFVQAMVRLLNDEDILVGFIGQLISRKGIEDFIETSYIIHKKYKNCRFVVVGSSVDSPFFKNKILPLCNLYKLKDHSIFTGFKEDTRSYFSAIDIFVNPSIKEPFAMVNLEAMATERPIIATNAGGNVESIIDV